MFSAHFMYGRIYRNYTEYIQKLYRNLTGHFLDKNRIDFFHRAKILLKMLDEHIIIVNTLLKTFTINEIKAILN